MGETEEQNFETSHQHQKDRRTFPAAFSIRIRPIANEPNLVEFVRQNYGEMFGSMITGSVRGTPALPPSSLPQHSSNFSLLVSRASNSQRSYHQTPQAHRSLATSTSF